MDLCHNYSPPPVYWGKKAIDNTETNEYFNEALCTKQAAGLWAVIS